MATDKAFLEELLAGLENVRVHPMMEIGRAHV